jgi:PAS domain S-box-containing protein
MRTTVDIERNLLKSLREEANRQGIPRKKLLDRLLRRALEAPPPPEEALRDALAKAEAGDRMLSSLMASVPEGITICDAAGNLRMVSRHGQELLGEHEGRSIEEVARRLTVYRPDGQTVMPTDEFPLIRALAGEVVQNLELLQISASGRKLPLLCNAAPIRDAAGQTVGAIVAWRDITEQRKAEEALHKVNRSLNALGHSSRAMNRATDEASYLEEVCRIVVEDCGRAMVWIGYAEDDEARTVRPVAHSGFEEGYLETLRVTWADTERGRGPTGTAVRTGRPVICRNMLTDPRFAPWRQEALKRGYASSIAIPLVADGKAFGAIAFYARESDPFVDEEVQLLSELASDLAYGITSLRLRAAHARAEEALRESEARFRSAFDDGAIAMALTSTDFHMMQVNPAFCRLLGYSRKELVGHSFLEFTHPEDQERNAARIQNLLTGKARTCRMEKRYLRKDGTVVWADMSTASVCDAAGKPLYIVTHIQDITERKRAEDALRQAKKELEVRVRERTAELDLRARQLARLTLELTMAEQRERQHLAQVLHDGLQQLLVAAKFRLNVLESAQDERVRQEAVELGELLTDSIVTSRLLTAELSPPVLKSGLVPSLEWLTRWVEDKHGLKVELDTPVNLAPLAENVTILLFQASRELLFNVVKHAGVKSARLTVASDDHHVVIAVEDRGRGFDPEWRSRTASSMGGLGLFAIGERIELLGGCLDIGSVPGGGSRVTMTVPFMPEATRPAEAQPQRRASVGFASPATAATDDGQGRLRIVLVDDHAVVRQGLATLLRKETQFQIVGEASDGKSAVELVRQLQPDVVLMDISMPGMDGVEATRIIHEEHPEVRIIGLSIHDDAHAGDEICRAGAAAYLSKSGPVDAIVQTVLACCGEGK